MKAIFILIILMLLPMVLADEDLVTYDKGDVIDFSSHFSNGTQDITGASPNIYIWYNNWTLYIQNAMNELGNGWYNYTLNATQNDTFHCKRNVTFNSQYGANTCDFKVIIPKIDLGEMEIAISVGFGILILFLIALTFVMKAIYLKILFGYGALGFTLLELNTIKLMAESNGMAANIISMLTTGYKSMMWITITLCFFGFIYGLQKLFMYMKDSMNKKNKRTLELKFE